MAYAREDIDAVRQRTDLSELAAEVTKIKKSGRSVMAVCPFHNEKTPSLSIDPARGLFHCFGCQKSGDVFDWVKETQGVDFVGAVELLARRAGVTLTQSPAESRRRGHRELLVAAVADAVAFYTDRLKVAPDAGNARAYLRTRGYETDVVDHFALGYSPDEWDVLTRHLRSKGHTEKTLVDAGLSSRSRRGTLIDRFRGRVMFPIYDLRGDPVGFGARLLDGDGPKYLNSPETPIYRKSHLLYGLNWAKSEIVRANEAVVVEGYTDVIAFALAGRPIAVATCGTALVDDHLDLLRRFTPRIVLAFDADAAGTGAALRGFDKSMPGDLELRVTALPPGMDPADLVGAGRSAELLDRIAASRPLLEFRIEEELKGFDLTETEARARGAAAAAKLVALHPDPVVRHEYAVLISRETGVELDVVESAVARTRPRASTAKIAPERRQERLTGQQKAEQELLRSLLANDSTLRRYQLDPSWFTDDRLRRGFERIAGPILALEPGQPPDLGALLAEPKDDVTSMLTALALEDRMLSAPDGIVDKLRLGALDRQIKELRNRLDGMTPESDPQAYSAASEQLIALEQSRRELRGHR